MPQVDLFASSDMPLGLYVGLVEGGQLDIRAAAKAMLAFDSIVRQFAEAGGLAQDYEFNLIDGDAGSLHLKAVLASIKDKIRLKAVAASVVFFIGGMAADEAKDYILGEIFGADEVELTDEAVSELTQALVDVCMSSEANEFLGDMTKALGSDKDVTGVGATVGAEEKSRYIRPRDRFTIAPSTGMISYYAEAPADANTRDARETVILTEPVLTKANRKWRFVREGGREVIARMDDSEFWEALVAGRTGLPMAGGIILDVDLEITAEADNETGLKVDKSFTIKKVHSWQPPQSQGSFLEPK